MATFWLAFGSIVLLVVFVTISIGELYKRRDRKTSFGFIRWSMILLLLMAVFAYFVFSLNTIVPTGYPKIGYQFSEQWASILHEEKIGETEYIFWIIKEDNKKRVVKILKESLHPAEYAKKEKCQIPKYECLLQSTAHGIVIKETQTRSQELKEGGE